MQRLVDLYCSWCGARPESVVRLKGAGSNREYYRLTAVGGDSVIGVVGTSQEENNAFIYLSRHLAAKGVPVPQVLAEADDKLVYLQTDLGSCALFDALKAGRERGGDYNNEEQELLRQVIRLLPKIQIEGAEGLDWSQCHPQAAFDGDTVMFDLHYFKYCFLKPIDLDIHEPRLEADFRQLAADLLTAGNEGFMYRDFQARNIMLRNGPHFIDYQGGRRGPVYYDVASFLWQAAARYPAHLRTALINDYHNALQQYAAAPSLEEFTARLQLFVLFRTLQVLGAYGFRGYFERKQHFIDSIPPAIDILRLLLIYNSFPYPYLIDTLKRLTDMPRFKAKGEAAGGGLVVRVFSFSYKKGIPDDTSGNGGGYVFDCRSTHNPGRYAPYKALTGLDEPVIRFLEDDGEITTFLNSVYQLADAHVERYLQRGFTDLMFSFGCTGGQHRSVYSAQHLAERLNKKYGIEVRLTHREQGITQTLAALPTMQAMVFAAGLGTRLRPLTDSMPKALVPVGGVPMLQRVVGRLKAAGCQHAVVNVHHFASQITDFLATNNNLGIDIRISDETTALLDTGGGIKQASQQGLFASNAPILIHNADIISNIDLRSLYYNSLDADATLLVSERTTKRYLLFDSNTLRLVGWTNIETGEVRSPYPTLNTAKCLRLAFAGIHILSPRLLPLMDAMPSKFGIIDFYLSVCHKTTIKAHIAKDLQLLDIGKLDSLKAAEEFVKTIH